MKSIFKKLEARHKSATYQEEKVKEVTRPPAPLAPAPPAPATSETDKTAAAETETNERQPGPRTETEWNDLISHRIEEAMRAGAFDNLRNKGKPLPQDNNPFVRQDQRLANDLLKNNGFAPQWITDRTATLQLIENFRTEFRSRAQGYSQAWHATSNPQIHEQLQAGWHRQLVSWQDEIGTLNKRINTVNLQQPIARLEIFKLILDDELKRVGMSRTL